MTSNAKCFYLTSLYISCEMEVFTYQRVLRTAASRFGSEERRASLRSKRRHRCFNSVVSIADWTKMVSRRCGLHSMVVYSYYIQRTGPRGINTTINTSVIREEHMFISFKSLILYLLLQDEPMGAVRVFTCWQLPQPTFP